MFDLKNAEIKDEEAETILQNRKWCHYVPRLLANLIRENKMVSAGYTEVFHEIKHSNNETPQLLSSILQTSLFADRKNTKELQLF